MSLKSPVATPVDVHQPNDSLVPIKSQTNPPRRILVVDDDPHIRRFYSRLLSRSGYQVDAAEDGKAGWNLLHAGSGEQAGYDLLITDNSMPGWSGVDLVKKLRSARMALPVIMATAAAPARPEGLQLAAIIQKPFSPDRFVETVQSVLHSATLSSAPLKN